MGLKHLEKFFLEASSCCFDGFTEKDREKKKQMQGVVFQNSPADVEGPGFGK